MTTTKDFRCAVRADLVARAYAAVSTEDTRYYLNGAFVTVSPKGGALIVATNGHWLVAVRDPRGIVTGSGIVRLDKKMLAAVKANRLDVRSKFGMTAERVLVVKNDEESTADARAMIVINGKPSSTKDGPIIDPREQAFEQIDKPSRLVVQAQFADLLIDGTFPDFKRVIPENVTKTGRVPDIDPIYVAKASKAVSGNTYTKAVKFYPTETDGKADPSGPVLVLPGYKQSDEFEVLAVVMPIRDSGDIEIPTFWKA